jgi:hypothetical protein
VPHNSGKLHTSAVASPPNSAHPPRVTLGLDPRALYFQDDRQWADLSTSSRTCDGGAPMSVHDQRPGSPGATSTAKVIAERLHQDPRHQAAGVFRASITTSRCCHPARERHSSDGYRQVERSADRGGQSRMARSLGRHRQVKSPRVKPEGDGRWCMAGTVGGSGGAACCHPPKTYPRPQPTPPYSTHSRRSRGADEASGGEMGGSGSPGPGMGESSSCACNTSVPGQPAQNPSRVKRPSPFNNQTGGASRRGESRFTP